MAKHPDIREQDRHGIRDSSKKAAPHGFRGDGTPKGLGFFGLLKRPDGKVSTELSIGVDFGDGEMLIPSLVPTLTKKEIDSLLKMKRGEMPSKAIMDKAVAHAIERMQGGQSPFFD